MNRWNASWRARSESRRKYVKVAIVSSARVALFQETMSRLLFILARAGFLAIHFAAPTSDAQAPLEKLRLTYSAIGGSQASFLDSLRSGDFPQAWIRRRTTLRRRRRPRGASRAVGRSADRRVYRRRGDQFQSRRRRPGRHRQLDECVDLRRDGTPEIRRVEDLKGKKIGISRFGSATDFGLRYVEEQWPIKRQRDFAVIQMGGVTDVYNALRAGALDAGVINAELAILARREGFRELADIAKMGISFPTSSIVTTRSYIKRNENTVRKFIRGFVEGVHFAKTQRAPTIKVMKKYLRSSDAAMFNELYDMYILHNIPRIPRPSPEALKTVLDQMAETDPRVANLKPEQFIDGRFFAELEKEGFIQKLWK